MPYDDSNIKKMIKYQSERKVGFSRSKVISEECKDLIHSMLESVVHRRAKITEVSELGNILPCSPLRVFAVDVFASPEKSNMAVTESDLDPKVRKMFITF